MCWKISISQNSDSRRDLSPMKKHKGKKKDSCYFLKWFAISLRQTPRQSRLELHSSETYFSLEKRQLLRKDWHLNSGLSASDTNRKLDAKAKPSEVYCSKDATTRHSGRLTCPPHRIRNTVLPHGSRRWINPSLHRVAFLLDPYPLVTNTRPWQPKD